MSAVAVSAAQPALTAAQAGRRIPRPRDAAAAAPATARSGSPGARLLALQRGAGNQATAALVGDRALTPVDGSGGLSLSAVGRRPLAPGAPRSAAAGAAPLGGPVLARSILDDVSAGAAELAAASKQRVLASVTSYAQRMPGYKLLGVVLGKDAISGEEVPRTPAAVVTAVLELVPRGAEIQQQLTQSGALERASAWLEAEWPKLGLTWEAIRGLFSRAWDALSVTDLADPAGAWAKLSTVFGPSLRALATFARAAAGKAMEFVFEGAMALAGSGGEQVMAIIRRAGDVLGTIVNDPVRFFGNLVAAVRAGLGQFVGNVGTHLQSGLIGWLTGALRGAIRMPAKLDFKGIVSVALDLLGLTWPALRTRLVRLLGERAVRAMETAVDWVQRIISGGLGAVADKIAEWSTGLLDTIIGGIRDWVARSVVGAAITKLISMFNPVGAVIQAIISAYNTVQFFLERAQQIAAFASSVLDSIGKIAAGAIGDAANAVEQAMARSIPVMLGFLARLIGLGDVASPVRNVVGAARGIVDQALDRVADWLAKLGRRAMTWLRGDKPADKDAPAGAPGAGDVRGQVQAALLAELSEEHSQDQVQSIVSGIENRFRPAGLRRIVIGEADQSGSYPILVEASPLKPAVLMKLVRPGWTVRTHATLRFRQDVTLNTPRRYHTAYTGRGGRRRAAPHPAGAGFVQVGHGDADLPEAGIVHPDPGPERNPGGAPAPQQVTTDTVQVVSRNFRLPTNAREHDNHSHAEYQLIQQLMREIPDWSLLSSVDLYISRMPCSRCCGDLHGWLKVVSGVVVNITYDDSHPERLGQEVSFPTTSADLEKLKLPGVKVTGPPALFTSEEEATRTGNRAAVPVR